MLVIINIVMIFLIYFTIKKILKYNYIITPVSGFVIGILYFIYLPLLVLLFEKTHKVNMISGAKGEWTVTSLFNAEIYNAYILVMWMLMLIFLSILILPFKIKKTINLSSFSKYYDLKKQRILFMYYSSVCFILIDLFYKIVKAGGIGAYFDQHWYHKNEEFFNTYGVIAVIVSKFNQGNLIFFTALSIIISIETLKNLKLNIDKPSNFFRITTIIFIHLLVIITHGNRIYFALFLIFFFFMLLILKFKREYITMVTISPILILIFSMWSYTRSSLSNFSIAFDNYINSFSQIDNPIINLIYDITEGTNILITLNLINYFDETNSYYQGLSYLKLIQPFLPDFINKIDSFNVIVGNIYMPGTNVSLNSTMLGEMYGNFGLLTFFVLIIITTVIIFISNTMSSKNILLNMFVCLLVIWFVRSVFSDNIILGVFVMMVYLFLNVIYDFLVKVSNKNYKIRGEAQ